MLQLLKTNANVLFSWQIYDIEFKLSKVIWFWIRYHFLSKLFECNLCHYFSVKNIVYYHNKFYHDTRYICDNTLSYRDKHYHDIICICDIMARFIMTCMPFSCLSTLDQCVLTFTISFARIWRWSLDLFSWLYNVGLF